MMNGKTVISIGVLVLAGWLNLGAAPANASDQLRSEAMGGVTAAIREPAGGIQINPATLARIHANLLSWHLGLAGWRYETLEAPEGVRFVGSLQGQMEPGGYAARRMGRLGLSLGYGRHDRDHVQVALRNTQSVYLVNEQRFEAQTELSLRYDALWETTWFLAGGTRWSDMDIGIRLKWTRQVAKRGEIVPTLFLYAQLEDVNPNKADEVIPAIMDGLRYDKDRLRHPEDRVERDRTVGGWDFDLGLQSEWLGRALNVPRLSVGVLLENGLQRHRVTRAPMHLAMGVNWEATSWLTTVAEIGKRFGEAGPEIRIGWEAHHAWTRHATVGVALRQGWYRRDGESRVTFGFALRLGSAQWEYALNVRPGEDSPTEAQHLIASSVRF